MPVASRYKHGGKEQAAKYNLDQANIPPAVQGRGGGDRGKGALWLKSCPIFRRTWKTRERFCKGGGGYANRFKTQAVEERCFRETKEEPHMGVRGLDVLGVRSFHSSR